MKSIMNVAKNKLFKLSPSDFRYLWEDCKHCYYRKVVYNIILPSIGIPGIFSKMNGLAQKAMLGLNLKEVHPALPDGTFDLQERFLKSTPIPNKNDCYISGRFDLLTKFNDGSHGVIDLKITDPKEDDIHKFKYQLHAYKYALENPLDETKRMTNKISKMGLLVISPEKIAFHKGKIFFQSQPTWYEIEENTKEFYSFIDSVSNLLNSGLPIPTKGCKWCDYKALM